MRDRFQFRTVLPTGLLWAVRQGSQPLNKETARSSSGELALVFETLRLLRHHLPDWHLFSIVILVNVCAR